MTRAMLLRDRLVIAEERPVEPLTLKQCAVG